jgi:uncharacterized protein (TIGR03032 family)
MDKVKPAAKSAPAKAPASGKTPAAAGGAKPSKQFEAAASRQLGSWLHDQSLSIAFTTYQANMLFFLAGTSQGKWTVHQRELKRCMGLLVTGNSIYASSLYQLWRFENVLAKGETRAGHDRLYVPKLSHVTGDIDVHDIAITPSGRLIFVNTLYSCLATLSPTHSFVSVWRPPFISKLAAEDRCHLNGLAMKDGKPGWVTTISDTDVGDGWREHREKGGFIIDVQKNEIVMQGLSMPHSPRWYRNRLWVHNSGTGEFGYVDLQAGKFIPIAFFPGYLRGVSFVGDYAVVGMSKPRPGKGVFSGLPLQERLASKRVEPRCGLAIVNLKTGDMVHWFRFDTVVSELYDVAVIENCRKPMAIGFQTDEIRREISHRPAPRELRSELIGRAALASAPAPADKAAELEQ